MAERQIGHWKSSLVLSARFAVAKWRSRSVAKAALCPAEYSAKNTRSSTAEKKKAWRIVLRKRQLAITLHEAWKMFLRNNFVLT